MAITLAFDVYGTLIDTGGVVRKLERFLGERAESFSSLWREKQLEYSFRRALMQNYRDFSVCTRNALDYACARFHVRFTELEKEELINFYRQLPPFPDAKEALAALCSSTGFRIFAFSNGRPEDLTGLLRNAGLTEYFEDVISVDEVRSFKPNPAVYCHFLRRSKSYTADTWLVSSNPFDVIGAISAGLRSAWVRRSPEMIFDPWDIPPTVTISSLLELRKSVSG